MKEKTFDNLKASEYKSAAGVLYIDQSSIADNKDADLIAVQWKNVHVPTYGQPIPAAIACEATASSGATTQLATPATNEVWRIMGVEVANGGGAEPIVVTLELYDNDSSTGCNLIQALPVAPGAADPISWATLPTIFIDKDCYLRLTVTAGTATDATTTICYSTVVQ